MAAGSRSSYQAAEPSDLFLTIPSSSGSVTPTSTIRDGNETGSTSRMLPYTLMPPNVLLDQLTNHESRARNVWAPSAVSWTTDAHLVLMLFWLKGRKLAQGCKMSWITVPTGGKRVEINGKDKALIWPVWHCMKLESCSKTKRSRACLSPFPAKGKKQQSFGAGGICTIIWMHLSCPSCAEHKKRHPGNPMHSVRGEKKSWSHRVQRKSDTGEVFFNQFSCGLLRIWGSLRCTHG